MPLKVTPFRRLCSDQRGSIAVIFSLALIPIMTGVGAAIDYSRANSAKVFLQSTLDSALIAVPRTEAPIGRKLL